MTYSIFTGTRRICGVTTLLKQFRPPFSILATRMHYDHKHVTCWLHADECLQEYLRNALRVIDISLVAEQTCLTAKPFSHGSSK